MDVGWVSVEGGCSAGEGKWKGRKGQARGREEQRDRFIVSFLKLQNIVCAPTMPWDGRQDLLTFDSSKNTKSQENT